MTWRGAQLLKGVANGAGINQSIAHASNTHLTFGVAVRDTDGFFAPKYDGNGQPKAHGFLTIPGGSDVRWVRLRASVVWEQNGNGMRQIVIKQNGAFMEFGGVANMNAILASTSDQVTVTDRIPCLPGDEFEVVGIQTSGGPLNALSATGTWFCLEVAE